MQRGRQGDDWEGAQQWPYLTGSIINCKIGDDYGGAVERRSRKARNGKVRGKKRLVGKKRAKREQQQC